MFNAVLSSMDKALIIFLLTYIVIAVGRPPIFRVDRTGAALIGASLMIILNVLDIETAYKAIDYKTIVILFSVMIVVANLRLAGFYHLISSFIMSRIKTRAALLYALILISGVLSALLINDTVCLVFTPLVLGLTGRLRLNPVPYLLALCMASNIGSVATITGNPQNIMIGSYSGIAYAQFSLKMFPVALAGLVLCAIMIRIIYREDFAAGGIEPFPIRSRVHKALLIKSLAVSLIMIILFFIGAPMSTVAIGAASFLLITRRVKPEKVYATIDWRLLILFVSLFIVVEGIERSGFAERILHLVGDRTVGHPLFLVISSALLSNIVSNVPAVMLFKPLIPSIIDQEKAWLLLAMSSTLAGNLTILGSIANLIVIEGARRRVKIGFFEYMKIGAPLSILSIFLGFLWLSVI
jgi:Na+/H+ antiporter NhaD/arsenite permease-like protein